MSWLLRAIGLFYAATGFAYVRMFAASAVADRLLAALDGPPSRKERIKRIWLTLGAGLTVASGLALLILSRWALPLMLINLVVQGGWQVYGHFVFPPEDDEDRKGRRQTRTAFFVWCAATALVAIVLSGGTVPVEAGWFHDLLPPFGGLILFVWLVLQ